ncbi:hypothetical protein AGMMS49545_00730 [Betaproteobacteria bacterium]|nr:hypothetical protein AGMMS49545_00730 [Betaproteobacteria bacterium]GHU40641.1 hypothetical protein AGMMS50289_02500 [Betaproteobacteria bacterium]
MLKKIIGALGLIASLAFVLLQSIFLYFMQYGTPERFAKREHDKLPGTEQFIEVWNAFGVEPTAYTKFFFSTLGWWWILPTLGAVLIIWAGWRFSSGRVVLALFVSALGFIALFWSAYSTVFHMGSIV